MALMALLGPALIALRGPGAAETQDLYATAYALCNDMAEDRSHFPIYWGWWRLSRDFREKRQRAAALLDRATMREDAELLLQAHHCKWATDYAAGDFTRCCEHIEAGLKIYAHGRFPPSCARCTAITTPASARMASWRRCSWMQGQPVERAGKRAARVGVGGHAGSSRHAAARDGHAAAASGVSARVRHGVQHLAGDLVTLTSELDLQDHRAKGLIFRGWSVAMQDDPAAGLRILEDGFARQQDIGTTEDFSLYLCLRAEAMSAAGTDRRRQLRCYAESGWRLPSAGLASGCLS